MLRLNKRNRNRTTLTVRKDFSSNDNDQQSTVGAALRYIPLQKGQHLTVYLGGLSATLFLCHNRFNEL
jgi:hypothetical protein